MSQDIVADGLNQLMNAKRIGKRELVIKRYSKVLLNLFEMMKSEGHIEYEVNEEEKTVSVSIIKLNESRAVKPETAGRRSKRQPTDDRTCIGRARLRPQGQRQKQRAELGSPRP